MASTSQITISTSCPLEAASPRLSGESAVKCSHVLQLNHEVNDIITNDIGHHNHIVHGVLTAYALGADPAIIQKHDDRNSSYQRQPRNLDPSSVARLDDLDFFMQNVTPNQTEMYLSWRTFFQQKIEELGPRDMLLKYVLADDARAKIMFARLFAGMLHPLIHFGFALEFHQPAILAEAIGQPAIHPYILDSWFDTVAVKANTPGSPRASLADLLDRIAADPQLRTAAKFTDPPPIYTGIFARAPAAMIQIASEWQVAPDEVDEKTAELCNAAAYLVGGALNPAKEIKFDFFFLHAVTSAISLPLLIKQGWISLRKRIELLEWKSRYDLLLFAARGAPPLHTDEISAYRPNRADQTWATLFARAAHVAGSADDGHAAKFVRGLFRGAQLGKPYEHKQHAFRIRGAMWLQLANMVFANMVLDSVESAQVRWIWGAGFPEAWKKFADREAPLTSSSSS